MVDDGKMAEWCGKLISYDGVESMIRGRWAKDGFAGDVLLRIISRMVQWMARH